MPKVLIVSGGDLTPVLGGTMLWGKDLERVFASSESAALEVARAFVPSLVVLDGADAPAALSLVRRLREHPGTRRSSIVVVVPSAASPLADEALQAGANLVLAPPIDAELWDARLERLLAVPRRLRLRFPVRAVAPAREPGDFEAAALDLSVAGMLVETQARLEPGARLELRFSLPGTDQELRVAASVVRSSGGGPARVGLAFRDLPPEAAERIGELLASAPVARAFGRYEVLGPLGEGSMGCVHRAFDPVAQRVVAIKTLRPELLASPDAADYVRRFRREAQAAATLVHPNIVTIFDVGDDYFVMELLEGSTLQALLRERGRLAPEFAFGVLAAVADALDYAHARGTIHRDVKPGNIMLPADGRPRVMDFGVAHLLSGAITASGTVFGSPYYMAPEQITRNEASAQTDIFSLAVVAYEMLTGHKPFDGESVTPVLYKVVNAEPAPASARNPGLTPQFDDALRRALAKHPDARFSSAAQFVAALQSHPGEGSVAVPRGPASALLAADPADPGVETQELAGVASGVRPRVPRWGVWLAGPALLLGAVAIGVAARALRPVGTSPPSRPGLWITTEPAGASVWLDDGRVDGATPLFLSAVAPASHRVRVALEGYVASEVSVKTTDDPMPMPLRFILQKATGTLEVDSDPAGASVQVDGERRGETPFSDTQVIPGTHRVLVQLRGHRPVSKAVEVSAGGTERFVARLERSDGSGTDPDALRLEGWVRVGDLVSLGPGVTPPVKTRGQPAPYPEAARRLHLAGSVAVAVTVGETGEVVDARVVESAGDVLDEAVLAAVRTWRYQPAESNGVKVRVRIVERQTFTTSDR